MVTKQPEWGSGPCAGELAAVLSVIMLLGLACFYGLRPALERAGWASYPAYLASLSVVFVVMLAWAAAAYLAEGQPRTWKAFLQRNRLVPIRPEGACCGDWAWAPSCSCLTAVFSPLLLRAVSAGLLPLPAGIPDYLNPQAAVPRSPEGAVRRPGHPARGSRSSLC